MRYLKNKKLFSKIFLSMIYSGDSNNLTLFVKPVINAKTKRSIKILSNNENFISTISLQKKLIERNIIKSRLRFINKFPAIKLTGKKETVKLIIFF